MEMQRFVHICPVFFFIHMDSERDLTAPCLVMRSNQLTGSSCENGETLHGFEFFSSINVKISKWQRVNDYKALLFFSE